MDNQNIDRNAEYKKLVSEFKDKLDKINDNLDDLLNMASVVATLPPGQSLRFQDKTLNKRDVGVYKNLLKTQINNLKVDYHKALRRKRRQKSSNPVEYTIKVKDPLVSLFTSNGAKLGPIDLSKPDGAKLSDQLKMLNTHNMILNKSLLPLCAIYMYHNKLQLPQPNKQFSKADDKMYEFLDDTFKELMSRPEKTNTKGKQIPIFDPSKFKFTSWSSIIALNREDLTEEDKEVLDKGGLERLHQERELISNVLQQYKDLLNKDESALKS